MSTELPSTAATALHRLLEGNRRFVDGAARHPHQDVQRRHLLAAGQEPFAVVLGCSDSRIAAEIIFDQGLGDLFVIRTAGHSIGPAVLGSVEYGTAVLGASLVVVLGHDNCGAVAAAVAAAADGAMPPGYLRDIVEPIVPQVHAAHARGETGTDVIGRAHVRATVETLVASSPVIAQRIRDGLTGVVGLSYLLAEGRTEPVGESQRA